MQPSRIILPSMGRSDAEASAGSKLFLHWPKPSRHNGIVPRALKEGRQHRRMKMTELEHIRPLCTHVMAATILRLWHDAQFAHGSSPGSKLVYGFRFRRRYDGKTPEATMC